MPTNMPTNLDVDDNPTGEKLGLSTPLHSVRHLAADEVTKIVVGPVFVNVKGAGAKGDGVTDDTAKIQAAINALPASGGVLYFPPGTYVVGALTLVKNLTLRGAGKLTTLLKSTHAGDGLKMTSAINSSTAVNVVIRDLTVWNTNGANTGGGIVDVGGTYWELTNVGVSGFKYGVILDQTELADIDKCTFGQSINSGASVWLVNGAAHTVSAAGQYTNRIGISKCQFNNGASTYGIIDDGGLAHAFEHNNFNGCFIHIYAAGVLGLTITGGEFEGSGGPCLRFGTTSAVAGYGVGGCDAVVINNPDVLAGSQNCGEVVGASSIEINGGYWATTGKPTSWAGIANLAHLYADGYTSANTPMFDAAATVTDVAGNNSYNDATGGASYGSPRVTNAGITLFGGPGIRYQELANGACGVATLSGGTVTVNHSHVASDSRILLTGQDNNVTGSLRVSARTANTSFVITSSNGADSGVVFWELKQPAA